MVTVKGEDEAARGAAASGISDGAVGEVSAPGSSVEVGTAQLLRIRQLELDCSAEGEPMFGPGFDGARWERGLRAVLGDRTMDALILRGDHTPERLVMKR